MELSVFDIFRVGIGPSSSHTVGPMRAAQAFLGRLNEKKLLERVRRVTVQLMGSLAATGKGHGTDTACQLGLMGYEPESVDLDRARKQLEEVKQSLELMLSGSFPIEFDPEHDICFSPEIVQKFHTNALEFKAWGAEGLLYERRYYSIGGGFIVEGGDLSLRATSTEEGGKEGKRGLLAFDSAKELTKLAEENHLTISELMFRNECQKFSAEVVNTRLDHIWKVMHETLQRGLKEEGALPGPLGVARRAKRLANELSKSSAEDPLLQLDWIMAYAMAVSEENAAGGRVVTAPTNGAAGVIPAVIEFYMRHVPGAKPEHVRNFLLTAGAIGILYKNNASISGAEVGCQGEVGVACSMAAAGFAELMGGTVAQVENAAEIAMEHNLGLTCDPVAGQVQIPCIERNAIAAVKAISAARMALRGNGSHYISLDQVIRTMYETGKDMQSKYKETSQGGLAVCIVEC